MHNTIHNETDGFNPHAALIPYGATKAKASNLVLEFSQQLGISHNCATSIMCPSGICGPFDRGHSDIGNMVKMYLAKKLVAYPSQGGFCFVDVRDVADAAIKGLTDAKNGESYIVSSEYLEVSKIMDMLEYISNVSKPKVKLSLRVLYQIGRIIELCTRITRKKAVITTGSVRILRSRLHVSAEKLKTELGIIPRSMQESLQDQVMWYQKAEASLD